MDHECTRRNANGGRWRTASIAHKNGYGPRIQKLGLSGREGLGLAPHYASVVSPDRRVPAVSGDWSLDFAGHANGVEGGEACLAIALPVMCQFYCAGKWSSVRQSWSEIEILVAVNEDGTRGTVVSIEEHDGPDHAGKWPWKASPIARAVEYLIERRGGAGWLSRGWGGRDQGHSDWLIASKALATVRERPPGWKKGRKRGRKI